MLNLYCKNLKNKYYKIMNYRFILILLVVFFSFSCNKNCEKKENVKENQEEKIIGKPDLKLTSDVMTPEILWSFGRVGEVVLSPDKQTILYGVKYYDISENKGNTELYTMSVTGENQQKITETAGSEFNICFRPDGKKIGFLYYDDSGVQLWEMNLDGTERTKISNIEGGINGFKYSPDQTKILYIQEVDLVEHVVDIYSDLPKANAKIIDDLMFRHWDTWTDSYSHIFIADYDGNTISNPIDIMEGEKYDSPNKPFGGMEQITWSNDSKSIAYTCVKKYGVDYAVSTNSDIYLYNLETKETQNLTEGMMGYDVAPVFSPDGTKMAWESMERDGYESDQARLFVMDLKTQDKRDVSAKFDQNCHTLEWSDDSQNIFFSSDYHARYQIYKANLSNDEITVVTSGDYNFYSALFAGDKLISTMQSMSMPTEIFSVNLETGEHTNISKVNDDLLSQLEMGKVEERWVKTTDGKEMLVWVIYPPHFDENKQYPALLYCQGGPQSSVSQFWSYRWNFQMMAANDYIIVAPNRRGLPSFGQKWNEQISGDYGGQNMKDYFSAIDELKKEAYIDENRLGAVGASYGGFSVYWLAGNHEKRFKAFISHDGMFNLESQYLETEELWFANWDLGGPFWDKSNKIAQNSYANSPHKFVQNWDTPILIIHGEKDYRISYTQGMQAFTAARLKGIDARYLHFPEENHWVLSCQNGILWQRVFFDWLDKYLKIEK